MPTELFYIYFINDLVACQPERTVGRLPPSARARRGKHRACRASRIRHPRQATPNLRLRPVREEDFMERFRQMIGPGMMVEDSDGNTVGKVAEIQGSWFILECFDGQRMQVLYDTVQDLLGYTVILSIPRSELFGRAA